ncbi:unnamed protein product [Acanthoscelides obtectus]|uniref:Reverse transcriptase domain-containing protein n=1 Tax=Acanthoscelides obtectus TaxID=200917 RepID=A0A9P0QGN6_ACAOB|nr:unnamed protein product [Acanthoscelides obtectus]CAK1683488.1 Retrovirus-related Pol polyprotein from type-2 retrotransposable element R2DM [Acanthoscelides obtectus]
MSERVLNVSEDELVSPAASPEEILWRQDVAQTARSCKLTRAAQQHLEVNTVTQLLRNAISEACDLPMGQPQSQIDTLHDRVTALFVSEERGVAGRRKGRRRGQNKRGNRRYLYARTQDIYKKEPGILAKHVRNNVDWLEEPGVKAPAQDVRDLYKKLWGTNPSEVQVPFLGEPSEPALGLGTVLTAVTAKEVNTRLSRMKMSTAPGPDGIKKGDIKRVPGANEVLQLFFNLIMISGKIPTAWRKNRTTLIPKEGKDGMLAENYRPITISSLMSRIYFGIIDSKLRAKARFSPRQKGFMNESGCFNNIHILNELLRHSKAKNGLVVTQLDVSKAFDTVPHQAIGHALRRKGFPEQVVRIVENAYEDVTTIIELNQAPIEIRLQRGVKQGDPLSPLLFNLVLEPLLVKLETRPGYRIDTETQISSLAFADDLLLVAQTVPHAKDQLSSTEAYLSSLGMKIAANKCRTFRVNRTKDSWYLTDPGLELDSGEVIPVAGAGDHLVYLGCKLSPWVGVTTEGIRADLASTLSRVQRLKLKPHQKVDLISTYIVPHYLYQLSIAMPAMTQIKLMDQELRVVVKNILHLPQATTNALLYCVRGQPDPAMQALATGTKLESRVRRLALDARIAWPVTGEQLASYTRTQKKAELARWKRLGSQGKSAAAFADSKIGNAWLRDPSLLKPCRMITALKMRTNSCADRAAMSRATRIPDPTCRQCGSQIETLGHILGQCRHTKPHRIRRHDEIKNLIVEELKKKGPEVAITVEPTVAATGGGNLKPDLVIQSRGRVFVVDVTVRHEDGNNLAQGFTSKVEKYSRLLPQFQQRWAACSAEVLPVVVGTRGAMPRETIKNLTKLGISQNHVLLTMSLIALRSSIEIYHEFMDYDAPRTRRGAQHPTGDSATCGKKLLAILALLHFILIVASDFML